MDRLGVYADQGDLVVSQKKVVFTQKLVSVSVAGSMTVQRFLKIMRALFADPEFRPGMGILCDLRDVRSKGIDARSLDTFYGFCAATSKDRGDSRMALVVKSDLGYGLSRAAQARGDLSDFKIGVFRDLSEAEAWLLTEAAS